MHSAKNIVVLAVTYSFAAQETQPSGKPVEPKSSSPGNSVTSQSPTQETSQQPTVQPQRTRSRFKRNAQAPVAGELPTPALSPTIPASVWNGPTHPVTSIPIANGITSDPIRLSLAQRMMGWSRSHWRLLASVALVAFGSIGLILLRKRAKREAALRPKYPRWSDEKIGPKYEPSNYAPKPGQRRSIVDELDLRELFDDDESVSGEASSESFLEEVETAKTSSEGVLESESSDEQDLEPALVEREIGNLLAGKDFDASVVGAQDSKTRKTIETALLSVLSGREFNQHEPARNALFDFNYFDDLTARLRTGESEGDRETAARLLGLVRDPRASAHLVVSLRDPSAGVRRAAVESIGQIGDPAAVASLRELLKRESGRELPEAVIKHAINSITVAQAKRTAMVDPTSTSTQSTPTTTANDTTETASAEALSSPERLSESETSAADPEVRQDALELPESVVSIDEQNSSNQTTVDVFESEKEIELPQTKTEGISNDESENVAASPLPEIVGNASGLHEAELLVSEAEKRRLLEADELRLAERELQKAAEELAQRRLLVEELRRKAEDETKSLSEIAEQLRADEESRRQIEIDLHNLKLETQKRLDEERLKFEEARRSLVEEQQRLASELGKLFSEERDRLSSLELEKQRVEAELQQRAEFEKRLKAEIEELSAAGAEQQARIEAATQHRAELESTLKVEQLHEAVADATSSVENVPSEETQDIYAEHVDQRSSLPAELLERLSSSSSEDRARALHELSELGGEAAFAHITKAFEDNEDTVRNAAAIALDNLEGDRTATFTRALKESNPEKRRAIGAAIASSGLAQASIPKLTAESREDTYDAFSLLFLMARAGELQPLLDTVSNSSDVGVQLAVVKLLKLTRQPEIVPLLESLTIHHSLSPEVKSALNDAIEDLGRQTESTVSSVA